MGTESISFTSSDITALQDDVKDLEQKLNTLVTEFNKCSNDTTVNAGKIDDLISKISGNYTAESAGTGQTGSSGDSILKRLHDLDETIKNMDSDITANHSSRSLRRDDGSGNAVSAIDLTALTGAGADTSADDNAPASVTGAYGTGGSVVTLGNKGEIKARKLARQTLNRLRK